MCVSKKFCLIILVSYIIFSSLYSNEVFLLQTSHTSQIRNITSRDSLLFTVGDDGNFKVWNTNTGKIIQSLQISHLSIVDLAIATNMPYAAFIVSDGPTINRLIVWNFESGERMYTKNLEERPLFIAFSPLSTYLYYATTDLFGLKILDSKTGQQQDLLPEAPNIVSNALFSETENTLLTYQPAGELKFWNIPEKRLANSATTIRNLQNTQFFPHELFMVGNTGSSLLLINLRNGRTIQEIALQNIRSLSISNDKVLVQHREGYQNVFSIYALKNSELVHQRKYTLRDRTYLNVLVGDTIFYTDNSSIRKLDHSGDTLMVENVLAETYDFILDDDRIVFSTAGTIITLESNFLKEYNNPDNINFQLYTHKLPFAPPQVGLKKIDSDTLFIFSLENSGESAFFDYNNFIVNDFSIQSPIVEVRNLGDKLMLLDRQGNIVTYNFSSSEIKSIAAYGVNTLIHIDNDTLIAGRNRTNFLSSLLRINPQNSETVSIPNDNTSVFQLERDDSSQIVYSLGIEDRHGHFRTVLRSHTGPANEVAKTLLTYPGEDYNARFAIDSLSSTIYTSLGYGGIKVIQWDGLTQLKTTNHIPRNIKLHGDFLMAHNIDNSFSLWNRISGEHIVDFYIVNDSDFIAIFPNEQGYFSSPGIDSIIINTQN